MGSTPPPASVPPPRQVSVIPGKCVIWSNCGDVLTKILLALVPLTLPLLKKFIKSLLLLDQRTYKCPL